MRAGDVGQIAQEHTGAQEGGEGWWGCLTLADSVTRQARNRGKRQLYRSPSERIEAT